MYRNDVNIEFEYVNIILYDGFGIETFMRILSTFTQLPYRIILEWHCHIYIYHMFYCCSFGNKSIKKKEEKYGAKYYLWHTCMFDLNGTGINNGTMQKYGTSMKMYSLFGIIIIISMALYFLIVNEIY